MLTTNFRSALNLSPGCDVSEGFPPHEHSHDRIRRFVIDGHHVEILTTYEITIDGTEFPDDLMVGADGSVSYHGFPQYQTPSAVDLVKRIVLEFELEAPPAIDAEKLDA